MEKDLESFKNYLQEICPFPGEIQEEFESLYGYGNAPEEPTNEQWEELRDFYISEGLY